MHLPFEVHKPYSNFLDAISIPCDNRDPPTEHARFMVPNFDGGMVHGGTGGVDNI